LYIINRFIVYFFIIFGFNAIANAKDNAVNFQQKTLTIAVNKTTYPYQFIDEHGNASGLMVDLWRLWAKKQGVKIEFIPLIWSQTLAQVENGQIDIHAGLANNKQRRVHFDFSSTLFPIKNYFYVHQSLTNITKAKQLQPYTIGVVEKSAHVNTLKQKYSKLRIKTYTSRKAKYQAALAGDILVFTDIDKLSHNFSHSKELTQLFPKSKRVFLSQWNYGVAVKKGNKKLLSFIEKGFSKISLEEKSSIERKWLGLDKQHDTLLLAFSPLIAPYMALSPTGRPQGLFVDLWRLWAKYTDQKIDFIAEGIAASTTLVKEQIADVMIAFPINKQKNIELKKAWHIYQAQSKVYVNVKNKNIKSLSDLNGYTLGIFGTSPYKSQIETQYPKIKIRNYSEISMLLNASENGDIDALVSSTDIMDLKLIQANLQSSFYQLKAPIFTSELYSFVSAENDSLAEMIQEGFAQIPIDELIAIEKKWIPNKANSYFEKRNDLLVLSTKEKEFLQQHKQIDVGIVKNWQPMEFVNEQGTLGGINVDIIKLIGERSTINFNFVVFDNWGKLYQALLDKKIAMAGGISPTPKRENKLLFTKPYWELPWVILHRKIFGKHSSLKDFYGKKIAVVKGYQLISEFTSKYPQISLLLVDNTQIGLSAIEQGAVDGMLEPLVIASELIKKESHIALMISVMDELEWDSTHIAIRKDWPELQKIVNKGILSIKKSAKQKIYEKWFNVKVDTGFNKNIVLRVALQAGILILVVIIIIVVWNRRLFKEVKHRKSLEEKMKHMATHDELTGLGNRALLKDRLNNLIGLHQRQHLQMAVLFVDLDGFKTINDTYGHNVGDELLTKLSQRFQTSVRTSDTLVRFGGDEFVFLLTGLNNGQEAAFIADKILHLLNMPFELSAITTCVSCSIGIALYPDDGTTDVELLKVADTLMYKVKAQGKNNYTFNSDLK